MLGGLVFGPAIAQSADVEKAVRAYQQGYRLFIGKQYGPAINKFREVRRQLPKLRR